MAKRIVSTVTTTLTAYADATNMADTLYPFLLQGGSSTQRVKICSIYIGGQSTSSAVAIMVFSRDSTVIATNSAGAGQTDAAWDPASVALAAPPLTGNTNSTKPQRSATLHLMNLTLNAFAGVVHYMCAPGEEPSTLGNTASLGEVSLSCYTSGSGIIGAHMVYEPL